MSRALKLGSFGRFDVWLDALHLLHCRQPFPWDGDRKHGSRLSQRERLQLSHGLLNELTSLSLTEVDSELSGRDGNSSGLRLETGFSLRRELGQNANPSARSKQLGKLLEYLSHFRNVSRVLVRQSGPPLQPSRSFSFLLTDCVRAFKKERSYRSLRRQILDRRIQTIVREYVTVQVEMGGVREQLELVFSRHLRILGLIQLAQEELRRGSKPQRLMLLLGLIQRSATKLIRLLDQSSLYFAHYHPELGEGAHSTGSGLKLETRRIFEQEVVELAAAQGMGARTVQLEKVIGLLQHAFQESFVHLARAVNSRFDEIRLFDQLEEEHRQSLALLQSLELLYQHLRKTTTPEGDEDWRSIREQFELFRQTRMKTLYARDWETFRFFSDEFLQVSPSERAHLLHRFEVYLCTLLAEVKKRSILNKFDASRRDTKAAGSGSPPNNVINW